MSLLKIRPTVLFFIVVLGISILGQSTGSVRGIITDQGKGRIVNAKILAEKRGFRRTVMSDADGRYEIQLPDGIYEIRVKQDGFIPSKAERIQIKGNKILELDFVLIGVRNDTEHP